MKPLHAISTLIATVIFTSCISSSSLITDSATKDQVAKRITERTTWLPALDLQMTPQEREGMEFLYAYMPFGDAGDYSPELYLNNVQATIQAKQEMTWSDSIPEQLFLHFVLPVRINNETLDTSRAVFYNELKDRVRGKSMYDAILETNHWCHEKVVYTPSDARTSAASATVRTAEGRCGEESTFAVAALRSIGIPARQIYVPRWAHTDDNHAWVEAWADGKWYYLGACEPEPVLNKGWFDEPAKRSMLMFTKVYGHYNGTEDIISRTDNYTEINVTANYAPVRTFTTTIVDKEGNPIPQAEILYNIYNYAELYPAVRKMTDEKGAVTFTSGLGDMVIWAKKSTARGTIYGHGKIDLRTDSTLTVTLSEDSTSVPSYTLTITPPAAQGVTNALTPEQKAANDCRLAHEDSIRNAYVATFMTQESSDHLANTLGASPLQVWKFIKASRGNYAEIASFLQNTPADQIATALQLLGVISAKDLRDTPASVLRDHLTHAIQHKDAAYFVEYILNPRIDNELLTPYRSVLAALPADAPMPRHGFDSLNAAHIAITPLGVHQLQMADQAAYERYAIALKRSQGIPARREPLTERPQYFDGTQWQYITLPKEMQTVTTEQPKGTITVTLKGGSYTDNPKYYTHFTLARLINGEFRTLDMTSSVAADMGEELSYKSLFTKPLTLETGTYQLLTGTRLADGTVLTEAVIFRVEQGKTTPLTMTIPESNKGLQVIGNINPESLYIPAGSQSPTTLMNTTGRGYFILALMDAKKEPTTHMLRGLQTISPSLETWGRPIMLVLPNQGAYSKFKPSEFPALPTTVHFGYDSNDATSAMLHSMLKLSPSTELPILVIADTFGRVVYKSTGYNTSLGEQLKAAVAALGQTQPGCAKQ